MHAALRSRLDALIERHEELNALLADPATLAERDRIKSLSIEHADLQPVVDQYRAWMALTRQIEEAEAILADGDRSLRQMVQDELNELREALEHNQAQLQTLLLPRDPNDERNVFLEIRAGTGGDEAALFAGDLFRMYQSYADRQGWRLEAISASEGEHGGYREIISRIEGRGAYSRLKFESGAHRVQRVPQTEAQGRIHTSACTVAILPEADEIDEIDIDPSDLRVDTYRASGAGGQHVNRTDSAVRITHLPTGTVVECQDERSQHKNRARAMSVLRARLLEAETRRQESEQAATRKSLVGSGDRSERIRTYNFPQGRLTDHRINLTLYQLDAVLGGDLDPVIEPLLSAHQAEELARLGAGPG